MKILFVISMGLLGLAFVLKEKRKTKTKGGLGEIGHYALYKALKKERKNE